MFQWSNDHLIGHETIDEEHEYFFKLMQRLTNEVERGEDGQSMVIRTLSDLLDFTQAHFRYEEELMRSHAYEHYESHRKHHNQLVDQLEDFLEEVGQGVPVRNTQVLNFLKHWLKTHFQEQDLPLAQLFPKSDLVRSRRSG